MSRIERSGVMIMLGCVAWIAGVLLGLQIGSNGIKHSPLQSNEDISQQYVDCKADAPAGFDCAAVFMLVSEDYLKEIQAWSVE